MIGYKLAAIAMIGLGVMGCTATAESPAPASSAAPAASPAMAQAPQERVFSFHSNAGSSCPSLDWHLVVQPDYTISGMVGWQNMQLVARVSGSMDAQTKTYRLTAKEVGGSRTATISGTIIAPDHITANINGPGVNCQGLNIWAYTPQRGSLGGGRG